MKKILISIVFVIAVFSCRAQMVKPFAVNSAGGSAVVGGNLYDWSFAEMLMINTSASGNLIVTAGVLQPIDPNVGSDDPEAVADLVRVYPNPTADILYLETCFEGKGLLQYQLHDLSGKLILDKSLGSDPGVNTVALSLENFPFGEYLLVVSRSTKNRNEYHQTFKIQKIQ